MEFNTAAQLLEVCRSSGITIGEAMLRREAAVFGVRRSDAVVQMAKRWGIMRDSAHGAIDVPQRSVGALIGGEAKKITDRRKTASPVCGRIMSKAAAYAVGMLEVSASMQLIVASPTAGSSGVVPGALLAVQEEFGIADDDVVMALFNTAAIGLVIMGNATVAGAQGGCQAEVGSASAMAASAITELFGGTPEQCLGAASSALSNVLGLVCDPIAGFVEVPCQKRNAMGAANALVCAEMALSGVEEIVPLDEMVEAMFRVGKRMPEELRETAQGGVAATATGKRLAAKRASLPDDNVLPALFSGV